MRGAGDVDGPLIRFDTDEAPKATVAKNNETASLSAPDVGDTRMGRVEPRQALAVGPVALLVRRAQPARAAAGRGEVGALFSIVVEQVRFGAARIDVDGPTARAVVGPRETIGEETVEAADALSERWRSGRALAERAGPWRHVVLPIHPANVAGRIAGVVGLPSAGEVLYSVGPTMSWNAALQIRHGATTRAVPLTNSFGTLVPGHDAVLPQLLGIRPRDRVLDLCFRAPPSVRADAVIDFDVADIGPAATAGPADPRVQRSSSHTLPFADGAFDFVFCRHALLVVDDPSTLCREMQRVARRGFIEVPRAAFELVSGPDPRTQWFWWSVDGGLIARRRPFVRHPFGNAAQGGILRSAELQFAMQWEWRNLIHVQHYWEEGFDVDVEDGLGFHYVEHGGWAHLDRALSSLQLQGSASESALADAEIAHRLLPDKPVAALVHARLLRRLGRTDAARDLEAPIRALADDALQLCIDDAASPLPALDPLPGDVRWWASVQRADGLDLAALTAPPAFQSPRSFRSDPTTSRFVRRCDERIDHLWYDLPSAWWSRPYEYGWALGFARPEDVVLDAASGICHPLKFALAERCRETHACDLDPRIEDIDAILADIGGAMPASAIPMLRQRIEQGVQLRVASLTALPYADGMFDRLFCISVLEHMGPDDRAITLREFARVTRRGGWIVLTMDHPLVDLPAFVRQALEAGLRFVSDFRLDVPPDALYSQEYGLRCFRALLTHIEPTGAQ